jgi:hypothetical protein
LHILPACIDQQIFACIVGLGIYFPQNCKEVPCKIITGQLNQKGTRTQ